MNDWDWGEFRKFMVIVCCAGLAVIAAAAVMGAAIGAFVAAAFAIVRLL